MNKKIFMYSLSVHLSICMYIILYYIRYKLFLSALYQALMLLCIYKLSAMESSINPVIYQQII